MYVCMYEAIPFSAFTTDWNFFSPMFEIESNSVCQLSCGDQSNSFRQRIQQNHLCHLENMVTSATPEVQVNGHP